MEETNIGKYELEHDGDYVYVITETCLESYFRGDKHKEYPNWTSIIDPAFKSFETASKFLAATIELAKIIGDEVVIHQNDDGLVYMAEVTHSQKDECMEYVTVNRYNIERIPVAN